MCIRDRLGALQRQLAWQDRPLVEQLHRFCGVASGRKELLGGALAEALDLDAVPDRALPDGFARLEQMGQVVGSVGPVAAGSLVRFLSAPCLLYTSPSPRD